MNYALIKNSIVENIVLWDGKGDLFSDYLAVNVDDIQCGIGWHYTGGEFAAPVVSEPAKTKESLIADVAAKRWQVETGGVVAGVVPIKTDRESQAQLFSAYTALMGGLIESTPWKAADGSFSLVTMAELEPVAQAVADHVRSCFAAEQAHVEAISELHNQGALDSYDIDTGWPV